MNSRHKQIESFNEIVRVGVTPSSGIHLIRRQIDHIGKNNHVISGNFVVQQLETNTSLDIRFYIMSEYQFLEWVVQWIP